MAQTEQQTDQGAGEEELLVRYSCALAVIVSANWEGVVASATNAERERGGFNRLFLLSICCTIIAWSCFIVDRIMILCCGTIPIWLRT